MNTYTCEHIPGKKRPCATTLVYVNVANGELDAEAAI